MVKFAVEEDERRGMIVYLYDEGMYPSGSAHGEVVQVSHGTTYKACPVTDGGQVAWWGDDEIYLYDGSTVRELTSDQMPKSNVSLHNGTVASLSLMIKPRRMFRH